MMMMIDEFVVVVDMVEVESGIYSRGALRLARAGS
jgi:hypothetical protein